MGPTIQSLLTRTRGLLATDVTTADEHDGAPADEPDESADVTTELYACERCDRTYVSEAMDACPRCEDGVERVPNKHDLGIA